MDRRTTTNGSTTPGGGGTKALELTIASAKLGRNVQFMGAGHMDPYCVVRVIKKRQEEVEEQILVHERSNTDWHAHKDPVWNFTLSRPLLLPKNNNDNDDDDEDEYNENKDTVESFRKSMSHSVVHIQVCNDSSVPIVGLNKTVMGEIKIPLVDLVHKSHVGSVSSFKFNLTQPISGKQKGGGGGGDTESTQKEKGSSTSLTGFHVRNNLKNTFKNSPLRNPKKKITSDDVSIMSTSTAASTSNPLFGGTIIIQTKIVEMSPKEVTKSLRRLSADLATFEGTLLNADYFNLSKTKRMGVSGGTAPFFHLYLSQQGKEWLQETRHGQSSETYYLGKDLSRAEDELAFYEKLLHIQEQQHFSSNDGSSKDGLLELLPFTFDYPGILRCPNPEPSNNNEGESNGSSSSSEEKMNMLVLRNLRNGMSNLRLLDLKMGQQTAQAKWRGKSRLHAYRQQWLVDGTTNSTTEGYRLEGFDGMPVSLASMDPLLDLAVQEQQQQQQQVNGNGTTDSKQTSYRMVLGAEASEKHRKKAQRMMFQHLTGSNILMHFINIVEGTMDHQHHRSLQSHFAPIETIEIVLHEVVSRMVRLARVLNLSIALPQKWIGSSVALGFDVGDLSPSRFKTLDSESGRHVHANNVDNTSHVRNKVICSVFDWGRSELLTDATKEFDVLSDDEKADRIKFWRYYKGGINTLCFNAAKTYCNTFGNSVGWSSITIMVMDFDSMSKDDFMGHIVLKLPTRRSSEEWTESEAEDGCVIPDGKVRTYTLKPLPQSSSSSSYHGHSIPRIFGTSKKSSSAAQTSSNTTDGRSYGTIDLAISWWDAPSSSRLKGAWRVRIVRGSNLVIKDKLTKSSDPYCLVMAYGLPDNDGVPKLEFKQMTSVQIQTLFPKWGDGVEGEMIDIPVSTSSQYTMEALQQGDIPNTVEKKKIYSILSFDPTGSGNMITPVITAEDNNNNNTNTTTAGTSIAETASNAILKISDSLSSAFIGTAGDTDEGLPPLERWTKMLTTP